MATAISTQGISLLHRSERQIQTLRKMMLVFSSALLLGPTNMDGDDKDAYSAGIEPPRLSIWPDEYKDFQVLPNSQSPDNRFAFIYPKHAVLEDESTDAKLFLVQQKPFRVLSEIPIKGAILDWNSFGSYRSVWTKGSSAALFTVGGKWGPKEVFVIPVSTSKVGEVSNLTSEIGRLVLPDLEKSGVPPIDDDYGFIFVDEDYIKDSQGASMDESTYWTISDKSTIAIRCICTTDPKHLADKIWEVIFEGTWDIGQKKFTQYKITHIAQDRLLPF